MTREIDHYEVAYVNSTGKTVRTLRFEPDDFAEARTIQDRDAYNEPAARGWTVTSNGSEISGLHETLR